MTFTVDSGVALRYRYDFEAGGLVEAGAWGGGASLVFEITGADADGCHAAARVVDGGR